MYYISYKKDKCVERILDQQRTHLDLKSQGPCDLKTSFSLAYETEKSR